MTLRKYKRTIPSIGAGSYVDESAVIIGDVKLGQNVSIWPLVAARGDVNYISIGNRTNVQDGSVLHVTRFSSINPVGYPLVIGNDVTVGHKCMLHGCTIGDRVLVGMGAIVMDGAVVEDDVMIAAGSLIAPNKVCESGYLYVGNPAIKKRKLKQTELDFLSQSAKNYVELINDYL